MNIENKFDYIPLPEPIAITEQVWPEGTFPLASTSTTTYNHAPFIRDCIEGILKQKTTFPVRVVIFDDCSTDGTREIVQEYETKFPNVIIGIYPKENSYGKPTRNEAKKPRNEARNVAKYIALCEGDDYWVDPLKLQKQVIFLEQNEEYVLTCHRYSNYDHENNKWYSDGQEKLFIYNKDGFTFTYPFKRWITKTLTLVYRRSAMNNMSNYKGQSRDTILVYFIMKSGKGYCFSDVMGVYRLHRGGKVSKQSLSKKVNDSYFCMKNLYHNEKNKITRRMYYSNYFSVFITTRGTIVFNEKFEIIKFLSLFYYFPIKVYRSIKRIFKINS